MKCLKQTKTKEKIVIHFFLFKNKITFATAHMDNKLLLNNRSRMSYSSGAFICTFLNSIWLISRIYLFTPLLMIKASHFLYLYFLKQMRNDLCIMERFSFLKERLNSLFLPILPLKKFSVKTAGFYVTVVRWILLNQEYFLQFDCITILYNMSFQQ